jgi:hypothetical protein
MLPIHHLLFFSMKKRILDIQIKNAAPHIFTRPFLYVEPNTRMLEIATFLARLLAHTRKITGTASRLAIILAYLEYII